MKFPHELTLKRLVTTNGEPAQTSTGGYARSFTTAARGALPTSIAARAVVMNEKEKLENGVRGERTGWKFLTATDPSLGLTDQVVFDYLTGDTRTVKITKSTRGRINGDGKVHHYTTFGEEDTTET